MGRQGEVPAKRRLAHGRLCPQIFLTAFFIAVYPLVPGRCDNQIRLRNHLGGAILLASIAGTQDRAKRQH